MSDDRIDKLGTYYVHHQISVKYGISFERFVELVEVGTWEGIVNA